MKIFVLLLFLTSILTGCDSLFHDEHELSTTTLREENGFSVISEQHVYRRETGLVVEYGSYSFKIAGRKIHNEDVARWLFPDSITNCHSSLYSIDDIRLLSDNSVLALMSISNSYCELGRRFVARIYADNKSGHIVTRRLPLIINGAEIGASDDAGLFHHLTQEGFSYGYDNNETRLNVLAQPIGIVGVTTRTNETFWFEPQSTRMINLGKGRVIRFEENNAVALLHSIDSKSNTNIFRAVRLADGLTLNSLSFRSDCYRPSGEPAREIAVGYYAMLLRDEVVNQKIKSLATQPIETSTPKAAQNNLAYSPDIQYLVDDFEQANAIQFNLDNLSGISLSASNWAVQKILEKETVLNWDGAHQKLTAAISHSLRPIRECPK